MKKFLGRIWKTTTLSWILLFSLLLQTFTVFAESDETEPQTIEMEMDETEPQTIEMEMDGSEPQPIEENYWEGTEAAGDYIPDRFSAHRPYEESEGISFYGVSAEAQKSYYRNTNMPPIRNQNPYGTCGSFSSVACSEINLLKKGYSYDLSELHLFYYSKYSVVDPLGGLEGDSRKCEEGLFGHGVNFSMTLNALADGIAVTSEADLPYGQASTVANNGLADAWAYRTQVFLKGYRSIPMSNKSQVKQAIVDYGAVAITYFSDDGKYFNSNKTAYYNNVDKTINHAVAVVGWDDNYSKSNFKPGNQPSGNGAWIIRNSWGEKYHDKGYFYLSYEDTSISGTAVAFDVEPARSGWHKYQYDGMSYTTTYSTGLSVANVFTAQNPSGPEEIQAFSFEISGASSYTAKVYLDLTDPANPESGDLVDTISGKVDTEGMYLVELSQPLHLLKGRTFSVVLETDGPGRPFFDAQSSDNGYYAQVSSAKAGQSFVKSGSKWWDKGVSNNHNLRLKVYTTDTSVTGKMITDLSFESSGMFMGLDPTKTFRVNPIITPVDATNRTLVWKSSDTSILTVDEKGNVTPKGVGIAEITAETTDGSKKKATCKIQINPIIAAEVSLNKTNLGLKIGETSTLKATVKPKNTTYQNMKWTSSDSNVAEVDEYGNVTAKKEGNAVITATTVDGSMKSASCTVVVEPVLATSIGLNKYYLFLYVGNTDSLTATVYPSNATNNAVKWSSSDTSVAEVDQNGKVAAKGAGTATIKVEATDGSGKSRDCTVVVQPILSSTLKLDYYLHSMKEGETATFTAIVGPENATNRAVVWGSSDTSVAEIDRNSGVVKAKAVGETLITVETADGSGARDAFTLRVTPKIIKVTGIKLAKYLESMTEGDTAQFTVQIWPDDATDKGVKWSSSDSSVAKVDENGNVTAVKAGETLISGVPADGTDFKVSVLLKVAGKAVKVSSVELKDNSVSLAQGATTKLSAVVGPNNATDKSLKWSSSDVSVASVDGNGTVTAGKEGKATITAMAADGSGKSATCAVTVYARDGWAKENGENKYWYENGVRQGYDPNNKDYRGKEIYDPSTDAWYWLDNVNQGAVAKNKDVYQDSDAGIFADNADGTGKWTRYDENGHMVKGWNQQDGNWYYFDQTFGAMVKSCIILNHVHYRFDPVSGVLLATANVEVADDYTGWLKQGENYFWYENGVRQGMFGRGKEIYDPKSDAWYWLDAVDGGKRAVSKDVYQESLAGDWGDIVGEDGKRYGKWVRYDEKGHMIKGWNQKDGNWYYFDLTYGTMAKGSVTIDGNLRVFDEKTGVLK